MKESTPRILFMLPEFGTHTHFRYVGAFALRLMEDADVMVIVEKGEIPKDIPSARVVRLRMPHPILRFFEAAFLVGTYTWRGYRTQYVHYSFVLAWWSAIFARLAGGHMWYWNCGLPWLYQRFFVREIFERLVYRMIDHLMTGADALHNGYSTYYGISPQKIVTCPNWVDVRAVFDTVSSVDRMAVRAQLGISPHAPVLLFVHRLATRKGAHLLPDILRALEDPAVMLVIAGDGPERAHIEDACARLGLLPQVRILGWVPERRVLELFAIADVFLLPSQEEGFPHVLTEAMASGVPYVATDVGGVRDMTPLAHAELIVPYGDVSQFASRVQSLLPDTPYRQDVIRALQKQVNMYDKDLVYRRFRDILTSGATSFRD